MKQLPRDGCGNSVFGDTQNLSGLNPQQPDLTLKIMLWSLLRLETSRGPFQPNFFSDYEFCDAGKVAWGKMLNDASRLGIPTAAS